MCKKEPDQTETHHGLSRLLRLVQCRRLPFRVTMATNINTNKQILIFSVTWVVYASAYLLRKPLGVIKSDLEALNGLTKADLGWLDSCFLLPYALVSMLLGNLGDKYGSRLVLTTSMIGLGISMMSFGWWSSPITYGVLLFMNGAFQALLWGNCIKALSGWYLPSQKTTMFGLWGTCTFSGGILGTSLAVQIQRIYPKDLKMIFLLPSIWVIFVGILVHYTIKTPEEFGEISITEEPILPKDSISEEAPSRNLTFVETWSLPLVPELCWTSFGMKLVRYCLYMWLPMYLNQNLNLSKVKAGMFSTAFEIGGVCGSAMIGIVIDKFLHGRAYLGVFVSLVIAAFSLCLFQLTSKWGLWFNFGFLFLAGACQCGPDSVVSGALASEIGKRENAQSAVSGVINGFGSVGSIIEGPFIAVILTQFGWSGTFYAMVILTGITAIAVLKATLADRTYIRLAVTDTR
eukprot:TCONS_00032108-protein